MGVDYFWKRVPGETIGGATPKDLADFVPDWFDDNFARQQQARLLVGAKGTGALIAALLGMGATGTDWEAAARAFSGSPANWDDSWMVGMLHTDTVGLVAEFLTAVPVDTWAARHRTDLADYAGSSATIARSTTIGPSRSSATSASSPDCSRPRRPPARPSS